MDMDMNLYINIECNECGEIYGFFPMQVMFPPECDCGNKDSGSCRDWENDKFGNFTLVSKEIWNLRQIVYDKMMKELHERYK